MVRTFDLPKSSSFKFRKMFEISGRHSRSSSALVEQPVPAGAGGSPRLERQGRPGGGTAGTPKRMEVTIRKLGSPRTPDKRYPVPRLSKEDGGGGGAAAAGCSFKPPSDMEMMKEKFAKLLLGEDMSGGGRGVSSAMALSDAITNIAASIFGEQKKLAPMPPERRARWKKETDWLLSVVDHIVELVPSQQTSPDGSTIEVMVTRQRTDLLVNIPALRKLDAMLMECLDNFKGKNEFWYPNTTINGVGNKPVKADSNHQRDWWIPTVKVPPEGLSEVTRKWLQHQKDSVNQVLKAAMAINAHILSEMEIPETYVDSLPKNGRASLGDSIYRSITDDFFDPDQFLLSMDLTSDHNVLDLKNRIEASIVIWKRKMNPKDHGKLSSSSWGSAVSLDKRELFEDRAETLLLLLKHRFPGIPQSSLDISKIESNKDVGHAVLESYSRVLESLASAVMCRIDDVLYADARARSCRSVGSDDGKQSASSLYHEDEKADSEDPPGSTTLMDFIGWKAADQEGGGGYDARNSNSSTDDHDDDHCFKEEKVKIIIVKTPDHPSKKVSYLERLENWGGLRSPTARH